MKITVLRLPLIFLFVFLGSSLFAQKNKTEAADKAYNSGSYYEAISLYNNAYKNERSATKKKLIVFRIGYSYYMMEDYKNAKTWLGRAVKAGYSDPQGQYYYAKTLRRMGLYDQAIVEFKKYKELAPSDARADQYIGECEDAQEWMDNPTRYVVEKDPVLNSKKADFSPSWGDKRHTSLFFTSTREGSVGDNVDPITGESYSSVWYTKQDKKSKKWMVPDIIGEGVINNGTANEGAGDMNSRYTTIYLTRCMTKKKTELGCNIYMSKKVGKEWSETVLIPLTSNDTSVAGHPSIGFKDQYMFFASDMPGGFGGKDIWFSKYDKKSKSWGKPVNMGATINTSEDELYPYIHADGRLFFASDGHPGMGALDIFVAERKGTEDVWENVQNMKYPINSSYNDFGIIFDGMANRGYLSTDRPGGRGSDDIWSFRVPPLKFILAGTITDVDEGTPIAGVSVKLIGTDGSSVEILSDELGYYEFDVIPGGTKRYILDETSYTMEISKDKYLAGRGQETTVGLMESTKLVHDFKLQSIHKNEISFPEVRYDLAKWELQVNDSVNSKDSLDFLYNTLVDNPTIVIELMSHTDTRGSNDKNQILSEKRAQSCVDYLVSKGIPADRMVAKGYGESQPRISDEVINSLPSKEEKEAAHQKNRRTTFRVLRDDYVPAAVPVGDTPDADTGN